MQKIKMEIFSAKKKTTEKYVVLQHWRKFVLDAACIHNTYEKAPSWCTFQF